ncbi:MAG: DsbA family protein [Thermoleophilia bacterium]|nr:DsbA family protein [Thermoleophilia bacterium]
MNKRYIWGAIAAAVVVVAVLVGLSLAGGDDDDAVTGITGVAEVQQKLDGLDQAGATIGDAAAPVEIVEFGDTSCPICKEASETTTPEILDRLVRTGQAKFTFRPVAFISNSSERGALAGEAAAKQDAMWPLIELIYANQGPESEDWLSDDLLREAVTALGLDVAQWESDYASEAVASAFFDADAAWKAAGGTGTPTYVVTGPRGTETFDGAVGIDDIEAAVTKVGPAS